MQRSPGGCSHQETQFLFKGTAPLRAPQRAPLGAIYVYIAIYNIYGFYVFLGFFLFLLCVVYLFMMFLVCLLFVMVSVFFELTSQFWV